MIKRQEGYVLKKIRGVRYLLPYGQKIADQKRGIILNETGEILWNLLEKPKKREKLAEELAAIYEINDEEKAELAKDVEAFVSQLLGMGILREELKEEGVPFYRCMKIAGMQIRLCGPAEVFPEEFGAFYCEEECVVDQVIEVKIAVPVEKQNGKVLIRNKELSIYEYEDGYVLLFEQMRNILEARMTKDGSYVRVYCRMPQDATEKENLFHAIRHFFLYRAQQKGFFAIHSASILYRDKAWLFSGHSGMGKSTHTALWHESAGTPYVNGDLNLIGEEDGKMKVYGIPWCGTSGIYTTKTYDLGGIVLLGRDVTDHLEELDEVEKIVRVMQRMISPAWTAEQMNRNLEFAEKITEQNPVYYLKCTKNPSAVEPIKEKIDQTEDRK